MATGVLPVAVGQATRIIPYLDDSIKEYVATMTTGAESDTQDAWGQLVFTGKHRVDINQLQDIERIYWDHQANTSNVFSGSPRG